jgi:hypothetical protein
MDNEEAEKAFCKNCLFAEPLSETLEGVLYFCSFRGCACSPDHTCHAFKNKTKEEIMMENEKMNNTEVEAETNTNEDVKEETPVNEIKCGHMSLSTIGVWGFYGAALGVRRSFRSTEKCDSVPLPLSDIPEEKLGENDLKLMKKLVLRGTDEAKFARAIHVQVNIKAPLSWWKQFDTYKVGTVRLSDSTMHNILKDQITTESFAASSIIDHPMKLALAGAATSRTIFMFTIQTLEMLRINWWRMKNTIIDKEYLDTYGQEAFDEAVKKRKEGMDTCWRQIIDMLPDSYLMESTVDLNYQVLRNICKAREGHKLGKDGWETFIEWAKTLPYAEDLIFNKFPYEYTYLVGADIAHSAEKSESEDLIFNKYKYLVEASEPIKIQDPEYISSVIKPFKTYNSEELDADEAEKVAEEAIIHAVEVENSPIFTEADTDISENG